MRGVIIRLGSRAFWQTQAHICLSVSEKEVTQDGAGRKTDAACSQTLTDHPESIQRSQGHKHQAVAVTLPQHNPGLFIHLSGPS